MKPSEQDRLLREILTDDALESVRAATLVAGVATLRRRRRRRALAASAMALAIVVLLFATIMPRRTTSSLAPPRSVSTATMTHVKWIDDERLLALFPERGVALVGRPGAQRLVLLDTVAPNR